jgi:hypothetical protein
VVGLFGVLVGGVVWVSRHRTTAFQRPETSEIVAPYLQCQ